MAALSLLLVEELEDEVGDLERGPEERQLEEHGPQQVGIGRAALGGLVVHDGLEVLAVGVDAGDDEGREDEGEQGGRVEVGAGAGQDQREREAEAEEVGPAGLDERDAPLDVPAHVEPLVLEGVQRVQEGQVHVGQQLRQPRDRHERQQRALHQEDQLHRAAEDRVGQHLRDGRLLRLVPLHPLAVVLLQEGYVRYTSHRSDTDTIRIKLASNKHKILMVRASAYLSLGARGR